MPGERWRLDWGHPMAGTDGGRLHGLVDEQTVDAALDAIDQALVQALLARSEREQHWQLNQLRGLLLTIPPRPPASKRACGAWSGSCGPPWLTGNRRSGCAAAGPAVPAAGPAGCNA